MAHCRIPGRVVLTLVGASCGLPRPRVAGLAFGIRYARRSHGITHGGSLSNGISLAVAIRNGIVSLAIPPAATMKTGCRHHRGLPWDRCKNILSGIDAISVESDPRNSVRWRSECQSTDSMPEGALLLTASAGTCRLGVFQGCQWPGSTAQDDVPMIGRQPYWESPLGGQTL